MMSERTIRGHPAGLAILSATELAERFSYYGMTALLALYMVKQLLLPGHAENVIGLGALRNFFEFRGPMSDQAFASLIYGWYGGLVYFTPLIGGWIADRFIGTKRGVTLGALLMAGGHLAMSSDATFLFALLLLIAGSGFLKGNISAQVGKLYPPTSESLRERGFAIFSTGINIGAVAGPIATGAVAAVYGWHAGFTLAAGLMIVALGIYLAGQRFLPDQAPVTSGRAQLPPLTAEEERHVRRWMEKPYAVGRRYRDDIIRRLLATLDATRAKASGEGLRAAVNWAITTLDDIADMADTGGDIPTEVTIVQNRLLGALAAPEPPLSAVVRDAVWELRNRTPNGATDSDIADVLERSLADPAPAGPSLTAERLAEVLMEVAPLRYSDSWPDDDPEEVGPFAIEEARAILARLQHAPRTGETE